MQRKYLTGPAGALVVLTLLVSGCGGDDGDSKQEASSSSEDDATVTTFDSQDAEDATGIDAECFEVAQEFQLALGEATAAFSDPSSLEPVADGFEALGDKVPDLADEFSVIADAFRQVADGNVEAISTDEYQAAADAVGTYFNETCNAGE